MTAVTRSTKVKAVELLEEKVPKWRQVPLRQCWFEDD